MKKSLFFICILLNASVIFAQEQFRIDGLIYEVIGENKVKIVQCIKDYPEIEVPEMVTNNNEVTYQVTSIGTKAFYGLTKLQTLFIPNSVREIGNYCFESCSALNSVILSDNLRFISSGMFKNCTALINVNLPDSLVSIRHGAFSGCKNLTSIQLPEGMKEIEDYAFAYCANLQSVNIPKSITFIGDYAFFDSKVKLDPIIDEEILEEDEEQGILKDNYYLVNNNIYLNKNNRFVTNTNIPLVWLMPEHKSVFGAGFLSFILPGFGQLYATNWDKGWEYAAWTIAAYPTIMIGAELIKNGKYTESTKEMCTYVQVITTCIHFIVGVASAIDAVELAKKVNIQNGYMSFNLNEKFSLGIRPDVSYNNFLNPTTNSGVITTGLGLSLSF